MLKFHKSFAGLTLLLLITEILIARYAHDWLIRPYGGDFLIVIFLYCLVKTFVSVPVKPLLTAVLAFAYLIEISQYFHLVDRLGLSNSSTAHLLLGSQFSWIDLIAYTMGAVLVYWLAYLTQLMKRSSPAASPPEH
ncbi:DUF2809 domain-containing protein [Pedobacter cryoconitis]|uniref:DNA integrity scanning protein DisA with diadenylate cyclase activity n=1 Tax=Pedobacter cryoconitis TaxID=188932 RepID=A0A7X0J6U6_9SPHI|nr:DUF2809 domain-containing protein [Pedobacter cryoconitis]MBB6502180.1 DNA integrity scanning protein DisA with diadenylate cyclase activity [Pedobacter cryoconitis]